MTIYPRQSFSNFSQKQFKLSHLASADGDSKIVLPGWSGLTDCSCRPVRLPMLTPARYRKHQQWECETKEWWKEVGALWGKATGGNVASSFPTSGSHWTDWLWEPDLICCWDTLSGAQTSQGCSGGTRVTAQYWAALIRGDSNVVYGVSNTPQRFQVKFKHQQFIILHQLCEYWPLA